MQGSEHTMAGGIVRGSMGPTHQSSQLRLLPFTRNAPPQTQIQTRFLPTRHPFNLDVTSSVTAARPVQVPGILSSGTHNSIDESSCVCTSGMCASSGIAESSSVDATTSSFPGGAGTCTTEKPRGVGDSNSCVSVVLHNVAAQLARGPGEDGSLQLAAVTPGLGGDATATSGVLNAVTASWGPPAIRETSSKLSAKYDPDRRGYRIFIGNLSGSTSHDDLATLFTPFGPIVDVWLASNPPGFGFVVFKSASDAQLAVTEKNGAVFMGRVIKVQHARMFKDRTAKPGPISLRDASDWSQSRSRSRSKSSSRSRSWSRSSRSRSSSSDRHSFFSKVYGSSRARSKSSRSNSRTRSWSRSSFLTLSSAGSGSSSRSRSRSRSNSRSKTRSRCGSHHRHDRQRAHSSKHRKSRHRRHKSSRRRNRRHSRKRTSSTSSSSVFTHSDGEGGERRRSPSSCSSHHSKLSLSMSASRHKKTSSSHHDQSLNPALKSRRRSSKQVSAGRGGGEGGCRHCRHCQKHTSQSPLTSPERQSRSRKRKRHHHKRTWRHGERSHRRCSSSSSTSSSSTSSASSSPASPATKRSCLALEWKTHEQSGEDITAASPTALNASRTDLEHQQVTIARGQSGDRSTRAEERHSSAHTGPEQTPPCTSASSIDLVPSPSSSLPRNTSSQSAGSSFPMMNSSRQIVSSYSVIPPPSPSVSTNPPISENATHSLCNLPPPVQNEKLANTHDANSSEIHADKKDAEVNENNPSSDHKNQAHSFLGNTQIRFSLSRKSSRFEIVSSEKQPLTNHQPSDGPEDDTQEDSTGQAVSQSGGDSGCFEVSDLVSRDTTDIATANSTSSLTNCMEVDEPQHSYEHLPGVVAKALSDVDISSLNDTTDRNTSTITDGKSLSAENKISANAGVSQDTTNTANETLPSKRSVSDPNANGESKSSHWSASKQSKATRNESDIETNCKHKTGNPESQKKHAGEDSRQRSKADSSRRSNATDKASGSRHNTTSPKSSRHSPGRSSTQSRQNVPYESQKDISTSGLRERSRQAPKTTDEGASSKRRTTPKLKELTDTRRPVSTKESSPNHRGPPRERDTSNRSRHSSSRSPRVSDAIHRHSDSPSAGTRTDLGSDGVLRASSSHSPRGSRNENNSYKSQRNSYSRSPRHNTREAVERRSPRRNSPKESSTSFCKMPRDGPDVLQSDEERRCRNRAEKYKQYKQRTEIDRHDSRKFEQSRGDTADTLLTHCGEGGSFTSRRSLRERPLSSDRQHGRDKDQRYLNDRRSTDSEKRVIRIKERGSSQHAERRRHSRSRSSERGRRRPENMTSKHTRDGTPEISETSKLSATGSRNFESTRSRRALLPTPKQGLLPTPGTCQQQDLVPSVRPMISRVSTISNEDSERKRQDSSSTKEERHGGFSAFGTEDRKRNSGHVDDDEHSETKGGRGDRKTRIKSAILLIKKQM